MIRRMATGYQIRWRDADGQQRKETLRGPRDEAEQRERELLVLRDRGERVSNPRLAPTFSAFAAQWFEERRSGWKLSTRVQYASVLSVHLEPAVGPLRVSVLEEAHLRRFLTRCRDRGLSARRTNLCLVTFKTMLRRAGRLYGFDCRWLEDVPLLAEPDADVDPFAPEEITAFLAACAPFWRPYFTVMFWSGIRPAEAAALKWGDVDWRRGSVRIRAGRYRGVEDLPKTKSSLRDVQLLAPVVTALDEQRAQQAAWRLRRGLGAPVPGADHVFTGPHGHPLNGSAGRERVWGQALAAAGLRRRVAYQTRHSFASNALEAGESPQWVARMLGHRTTQLLFDRYARWIPTRTRQDGAALTAHLGSADPARNAPQKRPVGRRG